MSEMNIGNARVPEQVRRMQILKEKGLCYFCKQGTKKDSTLPVIIRNGKFWYIKKNDFKADDCLHHYLIVPHRHIVDITHITGDEAVELYGKMIPWLKEKLDVRGYSMFVRSGDMKFTGATLEHTHYHFLVGGEKPTNCTLADAVPVILAYRVRT